MLVITVTIFKTINGYLSDLIQSIHVKKDKLSISGETVLVQVCLDGLGSLSVKHPIMAATAISCLRDFLGRGRPNLLHLSNGARHLVS